MSNSIASDSLVVQGSAALTAPCLQAAGGMQLTSNVHLTTCSSALTNQGAIADPYAGTAFPAAGSCAKYTINKKGTTTLSAGTYCGGLSLDGSVSLNPGQYIVSGGNLTINANASVSGSGVTIFLVGNATVSINGNATVNLSAPTSGTYSGILFYSDPTATGTASATLNGTAASSMTGALYFPKQDVSYLGNFSGASGCTQVVANTVQWSGNTSFNINCSAYGMKTIAVPSVVRLSG